MPDVVKVLIAFDDSDGHHPVDSMASFPTDTAEQRINLARLVEYGIVSLVGGTSGVPNNPPPWTGPPSDSTPTPSPPPPQIPPVIPAPDQPEGG